MLSENLSEKLQIRTLSIVLLGDFNPVIIQPFWLAQKKLIKEFEAESAKVELVHNEICKFDLGWATFEITKRRFEMKTSNQAFFEPIKDLVVSMFGYLGETPINSMGINHVFHILYSNSERYFEVGDNLVKFPIWDGIINKPKLLAIEILEPDRTEEFPGSIRVRIEPSDQITPFGVAFSINDHFTIKKSDDGRHGEIMNALKSNWKTSFDRVDSLMTSLYEKL